MITLIVQSLVLSTKAMQSTRIIHNKGVQGDTIFATDEAGGQFSEP